MDMFNNFKEISFKGLLFFKDVFIYGDNIIFLLFTFKEIIDKL